MKQIFSFILGAVILLAAAASVDAKTTKKSSSKATTNTANIEVATNYMGYPDPTGHSYKATGNGITMVLDFQDPYTCISTMTYKKDRAVESLGWSQDGGAIYMPGMTLYLSTDGKALQDPESEVIFKIIK